MKVGIGEAEDASSHVSLNVSQTEQLLLKQLIREVLLRSFLTAVPLYDVCIYCGSVSVS